MSWCRCRGSLGALDGAPGSCSFTLLVGGELDCHVASGLLGLKFLLLSKPIVRRMVTYYL